MGSVCAVHNESSMLDLDSEVCLAGVVIYCTNLRLAAKCAVAGKSTSVDNYRKEIYSGIISQLILSTILHRISSPYRPDLLQQQGGPIQ